jgi:hypothetical protein
VQLAEWQWDRFRNAQPNVSGDLAKNFKNEGSSDLDPGIFRAFPITNVARFLTREFIQNSIDASRDPWFVQRRGAGEVVVKFRFEELTGVHKRNFIEQVGLKSVGERSGILPDGSAAKQAETSLRELESEAPLRLLFIEEYGASGMYGPIDDEVGTSKMTLAMLTMNDTVKPAGAGGAYGQGKSVNAMASKIRLNIAYTCFPQDEREPEVTRRLLGVAYWPAHDVAGARYTGWGRWGNVSRLIDVSQVLPWENEVADRNASFLGFKTRSSEKREECGTSMLIVDPDVDPESIRRAVERYWWPAISDGKLKVTVQHVDGREHTVAPSNDQILKIFEEAYISIAEDQPEGPRLYRRSGAQVLELGKRSGDLALMPAITLGGDAADGLQSSLVAHVRGLGMVVKYRSLAIGPVFVQGTFRSLPDDEIETLLSQSENKTHYDWLDNADIANPETKEKIRLLVGNINNSVYQGVKEFSRRLTPDESDRPTTIPIPPIMKPLLSEEDEGPVIPPGERQFSINRQKPRKAAVGDDSIAVTGQVIIKRLDPKVAQCEVTINYHLLEDDGRGATLRLSITPPQGFSRSTEAKLVNTFIGPCGDEPLVFVWTTPEYNRSWVGDLDVEVVSHGA